MPTEAQCSPASLLKALECELVALLASIASDPGTPGDAEDFEEKMGRLVGLLPKYFDLEEAGFSSASPSAAASHALHVQAHSLMLERCVQWELALMQDNAPPRQEICALAQDWLDGHFARGAQGL